MLYSPAIVTLACSIVALGAPGLVAALGFPLLALGVVVHLCVRRRDE